MRHLLSANLIQWTSVWYECLGLKGRVLKEHPLPSLLFSCPWILRLVLKIKLTNKSRELNYAACPSPDIILPRWKIQGSMLQTFRICISPPASIHSILLYYFFVGPFRSQKPWPQCYRERPIGFFLYTWHE